MQHLRKIDFGFDLFISFNRPPCQNLQYIPGKLIFMDQRKKVHNDLQQNLLNYLSDAWCSIKIRILFIFEEKDTCCKPPSPYKKAPSAPPLYPTIENNVMACDSLTTVSSTTSAGKKQSIHSITKNLILS